VTTKFVHDFGDSAVTYVGDLGDDNGAIVALCFADPRTGVLVELRMRTVAQCQVLANGAMTAIQALTAHRADTEAAGLGLLDPSRLRELFSSWRKPGDPAVQGDPA